MLQLVRNLIIVFAMIFGVGSVHAKIETGLVSALAGWINTSTKNKVSRDTASHYVVEAYSAAQKYGIDPLLLLAVMKAESNYQTGAVSPYGARGLMQIVPRYHRDKVNRQNAHDYRVNIAAGAQIIAEYLQAHKEDFFKAIRQYSGSAGVGYKSKIKETYAQLRNTAFAWCLENDRPIIASYRYEQPRRYGADVAIYESEVAISQQQQRQLPSEYEKVAAVQQDVLEAYFASLR